MASESIQALTRALDKIDDIERAFASHDRAFFKAFMAMPIPAWVKRADGTMILSNRAYEMAFGIPPEAYVNAPDRAHWQYDEAEEYRANDEAVVRSNKPIMTIEVIKNPVRNGQPEGLCVYKYPVSWDDRGAVTAVAGCVLFLLPYERGEEDV